MFEEINLPLVPYSVLSGISSVHPGKGITNWQRDRIMPIREQNSFIYQKRANHYITMNTLGMFSKFYLPKMKNTFAIAIAIL